MLAILHLLRLPLLNSVYDAIMATVEVCRPKKFGTEALMRHNGLVASKPFIL